MKSNGNEKSNNNTLTSINHKRIKRMRLRSKKQISQSILRRKMAGKNSTLSIKIIQTKSLRKHKKNIKKPTQNQGKEHQQREKQHQKQQQDTKAQQKQKKSKQNTQQRNLKKNETLQEMKDTQIKDQINQKIKYHDTKFANLTQIGIPTINLNQDIIRQFIDQNQNEIKSNNESVISKLIGAIGEGYVEKGEEINLNVETKEIMIQKSVELYLEECGIKLEWTAERWKKLIKKTLFLIPYYQMPNSKVNSQLNGKAKYQIMFETLNLYTLMNRWSIMQMSHQFCQNFPFQTRDDIEIKELVDENELHNVRIIREYLSRIMNALNKINQLKFQREFNEDLYQTTNQLQDLTVEYYLSKMKVLQLKPVILPQVIIEQIENLKLQEEHLKAQVHDEVSQQQNDQSQERMLKVQQQLQQKKKIQINVIKSKTLLEYFKPIKNQTQNNNLVNLDTNSQIAVQNKEQNDKQQQQSSENKSQIQYFDILENFFKNKLEQQIKKEDLKK